MGPANDELTKQITMKARLIAFDRAGNKKAHQLSLHCMTVSRCELKIVTDTSTEHFESWLFFFLRDHGAYIETTHPEAVATALNLPPGEEGIVKVEW
jgi:hypothetical protein